MSEFLIVSSTFAREPLVAIILALQAFWSRWVVCFCGSIRLHSGSRVGRPPRAQGILRAYVCSPCIGVHGREYLCPQPVGEGL